MIGWREFLYYAAGSAMVAGWFICMLLLVTIFFRAMGF